MTNEEREKLRADAKRESAPGVWHNGEHSKILSLLDELDKKDEEIERLRWNLSQWLPEKLGTVVAKIRGKKGRNTIRELHPEIGPLLDDLDVAYQKWLKGAHG